MRADQVNFEVLSSVRLQSVLIYTIQQVRMRDQKLSSHPGRIGVDFLVLAHGPIVVA